MNKNRPKTIKVQNHTHLKPQFENLKSDVAQIVLIYGPDLIIQLAYHFSN